MSCDPCSPKAIVTCLELSTDKYLFHIHGLEPGVYYWRLTDEQGNVFSKQFTYTGNPYVGYTLEILASDVPPGLFFSSRSLWFNITKEIGGETKEPFLFAHFVEEIQLKIVCDEFTEDRINVGLEVMY